MSGPHTCQSPRLNQGLQTKQADLGHRPASALPTTSLGCHTAGDKALHSGVFLPSPDRPSLTT